MKYKINNDIITHRIDNLLVGIDSKKSLLYTFNETAEFIFNKVKLGWEEEKIVLTLAKKYEVTLPTVKKDVKALIKDMIKNKIFYTTLSK